MAVCVMATLAPGSYGDEVPKGWEASNMKPIGYSGSMVRRRVQDGHQARGDHWYLYLGKFWNHGWDIIDVTDPTNPKSREVHSRPWGQLEGQVDLHDNIMITALQNRAGYRGSEQAHSRRHHHLGHQ